MKKILLGICCCGMIALASSCGSNKATNAADGNNARLDSSQKMQDSTKADSITPKNADSTNKPVDTTKKK